MNIPTSLHYYIQVGYFHTMQTILDTRLYITKHKLRFTKRMETVDIMVALFYRLLHKKGRASFLLFVQFHLPACNCFCAIFHFLARGTPSRLKIFKLIILSAFPFITKEIQLAINLKKVNTKSLTLTPKC